MQDPDLIAGERAACQLVGIFLRVLQVDRRIFHRLHQRADNISLKPAVQMITEEVIGTLLELGGDDIGFDRLTVWRKLIDGGNIQVAVNHQSQSAGNRRSRHDQRMGVVRLFGEGGSLCNTEAVLLIGDDQRKVGQVNTFREQSVSSDDEVHHAQSQAIPDIPLFPCGHRTAQQCQTHPKRLQQSGQALIMLLGKDFGRSHQRRQIAVLEGNIAGSCGDHRFSGADISLHQTVHRSAAAKVAADLLDGTLLGAGQLEG